ncbi:hypothetical protein I5466_13950 [Citrobacter koseri]|uniref:hypothetical protein n=1 Tax=Citrobacter koseri TaxID=545 RepID=UPI00190755BF|nr:hypothetical protein [Citrobacter koseri]MBJ9121903.1 hypothetical protein [Citrobacter koseri]MBJ9245915.1 hypothetical protein [Citrobacter koseri]
MRFFSFSGRTGRILSLMLLILLMMAGMFAIAAVFMAYDPDGHVTRRWLHDSRWGLFVWRMSLYATLTAAWILKVRPQAVMRWPDARPRLMRMELLGVFFLLATEYVAWTTAV